MPQEFPQIIGSDRYRLSSSFRHALKVTECMCPAPHFAYMWQISRDGTSHFAYTQQIPRGGNSHFAYIWQVITGKSHFGGTFSTVKGYISADYLPQISEMTFSRRPNPPLIRQMTLFTASRSAAHWNVSSQNTPRRSAAHRRNP